MDSRTAEGGKVLSMQNSLQDQGVNLLLTFRKFLIRGAMCLWLALVMQDPILSKNA